MIYLTIFAGRQKFLSVLTAYLDVLLERKLVSEVHVWDFVRDPSDRAYVHSLCEKDGYRLMVPERKETTTHYWQPYYKYYAECPAIHDDDVILKCDDDIVYLDVDRFGYFLEQVRGDSIYFPNVYNNDVGGYWQNEYGVHDIIKKMPMRRGKPMTMQRSRGSTVPLTGTSSSAWFKSGMVATAVHRFFLENVERCRIDTTDIKDWDSRFSINFFGATMAYFRRCIALYPNCDFDDESSFSADSCVRLGTTNKIILGFSVVHYGFGPQNLGADCDHYLARYKELSHSLTSR
jgi:hypothetical protein